MNTKINNFLVYDKPNNNEIILEFALRYLKIDSSSSLTFKDKIKLLDNYKASVRNKVSV